MKIKYFVVSLLLLSGCEKKIWVMTTSKHDKPITGCLRFTSEVAISIGVPMNCQKSIIESKFLCSNGRMLHYFEKKEDCDSLYNYFLKTAGEYKLDSDTTNIK